MQELHLAPDDDAATANTPAADSCIEDGRLANIGNAITKQKAKEGRHLTSELCSIKKTPQLQNPLLTHASKMPD
jgi:hypothetical protein